MRHLLIACGLSFLIVACTSSSELFVDELTIGEQITLCEDFLDDYCTLPGETLCDDACIDTGCSEAANLGDIDEFCLSVFENDVIDCGITGSDFDCITNDGDCMIAALEAGCP